MAGGEIVVMLAAVFVAYYLSATFGFGDALLLIPILSIFVDFQVGVIFTGFWGFPQAIAQVIRYRGSLDRAFLLWFVPAAIPGIFLGIWLILYVSGLWMQVIIAIFILVYVGYAFYKRGLKVADNSGLALNNMVIGAGGFVYGTVSSWVGTPGPVSIILLESTGHYRENFIANNAAIVVVAGLFKLTLYIINGLFPGEYLWLFVGGLALCLIATKLGQLTTPKISVDAFQVVINLVLAVVGFRMLYQGIAGLLSP